MKQIILLAIVWMFFFNSINAQKANQKTDTLSNESIITLHELGLGKDVLKSKIQSSPANFDVSISGLTSLKKAKVPDEVISAMIEKSSAPVLNTSENTGQTAGDKVLTLESAIYYKTPQLDYTEIEPSVLTATKTGNAAQFFVSGFINSKLKVSIGGKHSAFEIKEKSPKIIFVFDSTIKRNINDDNTQWLSSSRSPKEFVLVKLSVLSKSRELTVGKANVINSESGIDEKAIIKFTTKKLYKGIYEISPDEPLKDGEYGIMFSQGYKVGQSSKIFDFSINTDK